MPGYQGGTAGLFTESKIIYSRITLGNLDQKKFSAPYKLVITRTNTIIYRRYITR